MTDEVPPRQGEGPVPPAAARCMLPLGRAECLRLLGEIPLGRVVFTRSALPAIRPVNHVLVDGAIIIRTHEGAALTEVTAEAGLPGAVVAYEADSIDLDTRLGWSVVAIGYARRVTAADELARLEPLLQPWVDGPMVHTVRIDPELVTGFRLAARPAARRAAPASPGPTSEGVPHTAH